MQSTILYFHHLHSAMIPIDIKAGISDIFLFDGLSG